MLKNLLSTLLLIIAFCSYTTGQEYFTIKQYDVHVKVNKDASLDIDETISVHFTEERHGIIRQIPYKYLSQSLPEGTEQADRQMESGDYIHTIVENIKVDGWDYQVNNNGDYKAIRIGSKDKYVGGDQQYKIHYRILNAINFFDNYSELYFNIIGDQWATNIDSVNFSVTLYDALPSIPQHFVATGRFGSTENNTSTVWINNQTFSGATTKPLDSYEGLTVGIRMPKGYLAKQNYLFRGIYWLLLPLIVFVLIYKAWKRWGDDDEITIKAEYYPPPNVSPSVCGYIVDNTLNRRDLTALIPYWGAGGYLEIEETESSSLMGLIKTKEYQFIKIKNLPPEAMNFEKTLFNGIFLTGDKVMLHELKDVLYKTMNSAQTELQSEISRNDYYVKGSRALGGLFILLGFVFGFFGFKALTGGLNEHLWQSLALFISGAIFLFFGFFMTKKTKKGTALYQQLCGFREFIRSV
ncbi:MAG: DUF2207 domain-containing protein, partial [Chitinophagaceae bacterium]